jgi:hypothetical protein
VNNKTNLPDEQLELVLGGDLGEEGNTISGLYQRILDVSFNDSNPRILEAFRTIIGTIVFAKVPLRRDELAHFFSPSIKELSIDFVLERLSSVLSIGTTDKLIHISHLSFVDFICDTTRPPEYLIDRTLHSRNLTSSCFRLMKAGLKFNICSLETSHLRNSEVRDLPSRIQSFIPTYLSYACRFAARHLRDLPKEISVFGGLLQDIDDFLHVRLLYWLEVMSLIEEVSIISKWVKVSFGMHYHVIC